MKNIYSLPHPLFNDFPKYEHIVIDTAARPDEDELQALADGCNLLGSAKQVMM